MKHKKLLSLAIILLLTSPQMLFAKKGEPVLRLKSGDWFETDVQVTDVSRTMDYNFNIRYEVSEKSADGNLVFKVSFDRMNLKTSTGANRWVGYDSYYPPYLENNMKSLTKQVYELTTDVSGKILKLKSLSYPQKIDFTLISVKSRRSDPIITFSPDSILSKIHLKQISEAIVTSLMSGKTAKEIQLSLKNAVGGDYLANAYVKSASFSLPKNAVIRGNIAHIAEGDSLYINDELIKFDKDGSFTANILVDPKSMTSLFFGKGANLKTLDVFLKPSDTLLIKADALDFNKAVSFSGNCAAKAALSKELKAVYEDQFVTNENNFKAKSPEEFISFQKKGKDDFDAILKRYKNRVSSEVLNHYIAEYSYVQGRTKLEYILPNNYLQRLKSNRSFDEFPKGFFLSIDTMPVLMDNLQDNWYYQFYLSELLNYQQVKLAMVNGDQYGFFADFATSLASLKGYPLYYSISESFKEELGRSDLASTERLKPYYEDFISVCGDTSLTNPIKVLWTKVRQWLPGSPSPVKELFLKDGSLLNLTKFKGKPLVLIVNYENPNILEGYINLIKKQKGNQVHFVIAQLNVPTLEKSRIVQKLKELTDVTYVELSGEGDKQQEGVDIKFMETKVFTFDSDFRVISSYLLSTVIGDHAIDNRVEDLIKKAIASDTMTPEQKASLINTIGWSVGSILFTSIIIFAVYRARLTELKKKNALKNQIRELEIKAIRSQMNPHFLFNSMNSIQYLINDKQYLQANIYLEKFSLLMRRVLNNSEASFVTLSDELEAIKLYCELEQLRFDFKFEINISPDVNTRLTEIPGMIIQPLVENSVLHGLAQKGAEGELVISINYQQPYLKIIVTDNGAGLKEKGSTHHQSFGLKLVRERLNLLNAGGLAGNLELSSSLGENQSGVTAILTIPID
ncbi:sensor histidine kinase [Pedobacter frigoris]|uniref:Histidine kinase domain-containing protein n=1 Tax=Pedobacter frigoris TaxID=2571272 RepID=A0A4U1CPC5_9SPHI|nr:histidine kinase [Pedobacter frigoris]TKC08690.1 hypothetical protein FA047_00905 [Pedobacter frigoris]